MAGLDLQPDVHRFSGPDDLAVAVAADLVDVLAQVQESGGTPSVVLTGGTVARTIHRAVADHPDAAHVDWSRVEVWWGDERFVPADDEERNAGQARVDLLERLPFDGDRVHEMPASGSGQVDVDAAAAAYAEKLRAVLADRGDAPWFDVLMLGIGPDGHCASLFPGRPEVGSQGLTIGVSGSPKPPPERVSMTMPTLRRARRVWFVATGEGKADAIARSVAGGDIEQTPAAGPRGVESTTWYVDSAAAAKL